jgi:hypothetical protein
MLEQWTPRNPGSRRGISDFKSILSFALRYCPAVQSRVKDNASDALEILLAQAEMLQRIARETKDAAQRERLDALARECLNVARLVGDNGVRTDRKADG